MDLRKQIDDLLQAPMDRTNFLKTVGAGVATLMGLGWFIQMTAERHDTPKTAGYGAMAYGGEADGKQNTRKHPQGTT